MATYISKQDGNFTDAASWATVEAGTGAIVTSNGGQTATSTSYVYSAAFTGTNTNVCDGLLLYCVRGGVSTGTVSVALSDDNGTTATREVTVNASDLPSVFSWVFFKFSSTLTLDGGTDYKVGIKSSYASNAQFQRGTAQAGDWCRYLRLTTAASSLAAGDVFFIVGEYTAAATYTSRTITMDSTATTQYGTLNICPRGKLEYGTSASTNYNLTLAGDCIVYDTGTLNIGTSGTPIPRTSTAVLEFVCTSAGQYGLQVYGTCNAYGQSRTSGKDIYYCRLSADASASATSLTVDTDTGWLNGDTIALAPTTRTYTQYEDRTLNADATSSGLSVSSGLTNAHSGTSPTQAEIINLTRNVKIRSNASAAANATYIRAYAASTVNLYWVEAYYLGANSAGKYGVVIETTTGSFDMRYCSVHDMFYHMHISSSSGSNITVRYNSFYKIATASSTSQGILIAATSGANTFSDNIIIASLSSFYAVNSNDVGGYIDNNSVSGSAGLGFVLNENGLIGSFSGNISHSNNNSGLGLLNNAAYGVIDTIALWRTATYGIFSSVSSGKSLEIKNATVFGNSTSNVVFRAPAEITFSGSSFYSETSYSTPIGFEIPYDLNGTAKFINCEFSPAGKTAHTSDISITSTVVPVNINIDLNNTLLGATTEVANQSSLASNSQITSSKHDKTAGAYKTWRTWGTIERDTTFYNTASPSERLTPTNASNKLPSGSHVAGVDSGSTLTVSVYIRKSASGDGAAYNGNQPRLIVKRNDAVGITADTVLATYSSGTGSWNQISGTTAAATDTGAMEFYVDCDGTAGWINVDDWAVT